MSIQPPACNGSPLQDRRIRLGQYALLPSAPRIPPPSARRSACSRHWSPCRQGAQQVRSSGLQDRRRRQQGADQGDARIHQHAGQALFDQVDQAEGAPHGGEHAVGQQVELVPEAPGQAARTRLRLAAWRRGQAQARLREPRRAAAESTPPVPRRRGPGPRPGSNEHRGHQPTPWSVTSGRRSDTASPPGIRASHLRGSSMRTQTVKGLPRRVGMVAVAGSGNRACG